ncbi:MAG: DUF6702 family protein [Chitinophagaceae bacterium]
MVILFYKWFFVSLFSAFSLFNVTDKKAENVKHPFYVSVTEINHNAKEKTLEISVKIFADDLEDVLKQNYKTPVDVSSEKGEAQNGKLIKDYISKHLSLAIDGKQATLHYVGFEKQSESVYCYFDVANIAAVKKLDVTNSLLQDFNNEQINIMHIIVNGSRKSYKLDFPNKQASFSF